MIGRAATLAVAGLAAGPWALAAGSAQAGADHLQRVFRLGCVETLPDFAGAGEVFERLGMTPGEPEQGFATYAGEAFDGRTRTPADGDVDPACAVRDTDPSPRTSATELRRDLVDALGEPESDRCRLDPARFCSVYWQREDACVQLSAAMFQGGVLVAWLIRWRGRECPS